MSPYVSVLSLKVRNIKGTFIFIIWKFNFGFNAILLFNLNVATKQDFNKIQIIWIIRIWYWHILHYKIWRRHNYTLFYNRNIVYHWSWNCHIRNKTAYQSVCLVNGFVIWNQKWRRDYLKQRFRWINVENFRITLHILLK